MLKCVCIYKYIKNCLGNLFVTEPHKKRLDVDVLDCGYKCPCRLDIHRHKAYFIVL